MKEVSYGYSSGTYAGLTHVDRVSLLPRQEEIDTLGSDLHEKTGSGGLSSFIISKPRRYCNHGVTPVIMSFART